ncbi:MAG: LCP family protein [Lachnospiraceae bacterium]|nr:LCP family protein [Lachnospiraceae bacterium]
MRNQKRNKNRGKKHIGLGILIALTTVVIVAAGTVMIARAMGRSKLYNQAVSHTPKLVIEDAEPLTEEEQQVWKEGWVKYDDRIYEYNDKLITFLFMGIDKRDEEVKEVSEGTNGGQADALFLLILDPTEKAVKVIAINRNTMVPVDVYDENGAYVSTVTAQVNTQHGFGNGMEESCEYQMKAVDNLFYNVPIHGYFAINMKAVKTITDAVGGIDLMVLEDVTTTGDHKQIFTKGEEIHLDGEAAYKYVSVRDTAVSASANGRLERQKQFINILIGKLKVMTKADITTPVKIYNAISDQMVTNITANETAYLAGEARDYTFDARNIYTLDGEYIAAEDNPDSDYDEFYVDEDALKALIIDVFYREVER